MPYPKQLVDLPLAKGLDTKSDAKIAQGLLSVSNAHMRSTGLLEKRRAMVQLHKGSVNGGVTETAAVGYRPQTAHFIESYGLYNSNDSLLLLGRDKLRSTPDLEPNLNTGDLLSSYSKVFNRWNPVAPVTPCAVDVKRIGETNNVLNPNIAIGGGYQVVMFDITNASGSPAVMVCVINQQTGATIWKYESPANYTASGGRFVWSASAGRYKYVGIISDYTSGTKMQFVTWDPGTPATAPVLLSSGTTNNSIAMDCCLSNDEQTLWVAFYDQTTTFVITQGYDADGTALFAERSLGIMPNGPATIFIATGSLGTESINVAFQENNGGADPGTHPGYLWVFILSTSNTVAHSNSDNATFTVGSWYQITGCPVDVVSAGVYLDRSFLLAVTDVRGADGFTRVALFKNSNARPINGTLRNIRRSNIAAKAFQHNNRAYLPVVYTDGGSIAGVSTTIPTETALFLYSFHSLDAVTAGSSDNLHVPFIVAKAMHNRALGPSSASSGFNILSQVVRDGDSFTFVAQRLERVSRATGIYAISSFESVISMVACKFTLGEAAPAAVEFGRSSVLPGSVVACLDGSHQELNFHILPRAPTLTNLGAGVMGAGTYSYVVVAEWSDRNGQIYRSAPSLPAAITIAANRQVRVSVRLVPHVSITRYNSYALTLRVYRTAVGGSSYYLVGSITSQYLDTNLYTTTVDDITTDTVLVGNSPLYTNTGELEPTAPPPSRIMAASHERLFAIADDDRTAVWYTKAKQEAYGPEFVDGMYIRIETDGDGTGLAIQDGQQLVFKERAIYVFAGDGPNELGQGSFSTPRKLPTEIGCVDSKSVITFRNGTIFRSEGGYYLLDRSLQLQPIGLPVAAFQDLEVASCCLVPTLDQIWWALKDTPTVLVYDYIHGIWGTHEMPVSLRGLTFCEGRVAVSGSDGSVWVYDASLPAEGAFKLSTPWYKSQSIQGMQKVWWLHLTGRLDAAFQVRVFYDYEDGEGSYSQVFNLSAKKGRKLLRLKPAKRKCVSFRLDIEQVGDLRKDMGLNALSVALASLGRLARLASAETK